MKKRILNIVYSVIIMITLISLYHITIVAEESENNLINRMEINAEEYEKIRTYLIDISEYDDSYFIEEDFFIQKKLDLYDADLEKNVYEFFTFGNNNIVEGYVILRTSDKTIIESSVTNIMPYNYEKKDIDYVYNYYDYGYVNLDGSIVYRSKLEEVDEKFDLIINQNMRKIQLPNAKIYLQKSHNCIACAMAHAVVYYKYNGYPNICSVINQNGFESLMAILESNMNSVGGMANKNISLAFAKYAENSLGNKYRILSNGITSPSYATLKNAITNGFPVMLGYAAGSPYSSIYGHMTLCIGAANLAVENEYVIIIDGHSSSTVTRLWNSLYNDYINIIGVVPT